MGSPVSSIVFKVANSLRPDVSHKKRKKKKEIGVVCPQSSSELNKLKSLNKGPPPPPRVGRLQWKLLQGSV